MFNVKSNRQEVFSVATRVRVAPQHHCTGRTCTVHVRTACVVLFSALFESTLCSSVIDVIARSISMFFDAEIIKYGS
jgi:hypothetical protein